MKQPTFEEAVQLVVERLRGQQISAISIGLATASERIAHANECGNCFEALEFEIGRKIQRGWSVDPEYMEWVGGVLTRTIPRPPKKKGQPKKPSNELTILDAVSHLVGLQMKPTRNPLKNGPHDSACDAVAEAFKREKRMPRSYKRIEEIWLKHRPKNVPDITPE